MGKVLSISIAAYNAEKYLDKCLKSLLETKVKDALEVMIVNDGSKDHTLSIANKYQKEYPEIIKVIDKKNGGHGSTINASVKAATGKYYKILDSDDWVDKNGLEKLVRFLENNSVDLVLNPFHEVHIDTGIKNLVVPYHKNQKIGEIMDLSKDTNFDIKMHSMTFKTDVIKAMGPIIDENCFYVDAEYTCYALAYAKNYVCLDFSVYQYMLGSNEQSMNITKMIERRDQHLRVVKSLANFFSRLDASSATYQLIERRIKSIVVLQYGLFMRVADTKASKKEIMAFDQWIRLNCPTCSDGVKSKLMTIVKCLRKTHFHFYALACHLVNKFGNLG